MFRRLRIKPFYLLAQKKLPCPREGAGRQGGQPLRISKKRTQLLGQTRRDAGCIQPSRIDDDSGRRRYNLLRTAEIEASDRQSSTEGFQNHPSRAVVQAGEDEDVVGVVEM